METMRFGIIIFGASGSGTTTIGHELARLLGCKHFDIDDYFWEKTSLPFTIKCPLDERIKKLKTDLTENFVLSGSMLGWSETFEPLFTTAVYVTTPTDIRIERLKNREFKRFGDRILPSGDMYDNHIEFIEWAKTYDYSGEQQRSKMAHENWVNTLPCPVIRVDGTWDYHNTAKEIAEIIKG
jgi:adenylate kinase family enzyme